MTAPALLLPDTVDWPSIDYRRLEPERRSIVDSWLTSQAEALGLRHAMTLRQLSVFTSAARTMTQPILFGGGMGGGKSFLLCELAFWLGDQVPMNYVALARHERERFMDTTYKALMKVWQKHPEWKHSPGKSSFFNPKNGSEIHYMGLKDIERVRSAEWGALLYDEVTDEEREDFNILKTRIRLPQASADFHPRGEEWRMIVCTCNPLPGWVKEDWISEPLDGYTFIRSLALDNWHQPSTYIPEMEEALPSHVFRAFIEGNWDALSPVDAALPATLLEEMRQRKLDLDPTICDWGVDVGHKGGDATVITAKYGADESEEGPVFAHVDEWVGERTTNSREWIIKLYEHAEVKPQRIMIDCTGIGAGLGDQLVEESWKGRLGDAAIVEVHASERPHKRYKGKYASVKAVHIFKLRHIAERNRAQIPWDRRYTRDLAAVTSHERLGKTYVDNNEIVRAKNGQSPNWGDSLLLTLYEGERYVIPKRRNPDEDLEDLDEEERQAELQRREALRRREVGRDKFFEQFAPNRRPRDNRGGQPY